MVKSRVDEFRRKRKALSLPPARGAEHIGSILPRVMHAIAKNVMLDGGITRAKFEADPEQSLNLLLEAAKRTDGEFNASTVLEVLFAWIKDAEKVRLVIRQWLDKVPTRCWRNLRQLPFLQGLQDLLESFTGEQGELTFQ